jgi:hypothetical protein
LSEPNAFLGEAVEVRSFDGFLAVTGKVAVAHVVYEDEKEIGARGRSGLQEAKK